MLSSSTAVNHSRRPVAVIHIAGAMKTLMELRPSNTQFHVVTNFSPRILKFFCQSATLLWGCRLLEGAANEFHIEPLFLLMNQSHHDNCGVQISFTGN